MPSTWTLIEYVIIIAAAVAMVVVLRARRRSHRQFIQDTADQEVCEHLRCAYELLRQRGHVVVRAGQKAPDFPLEVHMAPPFDPQAIYDQLKLQEPVFVSERNVLACREDLVELTPET